MTIIRKFCWTIWWKGRRRYFHQ